jgi:hypothetical protein
VERAFCVWIQVPPGSNSHTILAARGIEVLSVGLFAGSRGMG